MNPSNTPAVTGPFSTWAYVLPIEETILTDVRGVLEKDALLNAGSPFGAQPR